MNIEEFYAEVAQIEGWQREPRGQRIRLPNGDCPLTAVTNKIHGTAFSSRVEAFAAGLKLGFSTNQIARIITASDSDGSHIVRAKLLDAAKLPRQKELDAE